MINFKTNNMSNSLRTFINVNNVLIDETHEELWYSKLNDEHWSNINKRYLLRIFNPLKKVMETESKPKWGMIIKEMVGYNHLGYYSSVYKTLKEIKVIKYSKTERCIEKGVNWERFYGSEDWSWFVMNTSSGMKSYIK